MEKSVKAEIPILPETVPIPLDDLASLKKVFEEAGEVAAVANNVGIRFIKEIADRIKLASATVQMVEDTEQKVNDSVRRVLLNLGVEPEEYRGIDLEKGVFKIQKAPVEAKVTS